MVLHRGPVVGPHPSWALKGRPEQQESAPKWKKQGPRTLLDGRYTLSELAGAALRHVQVLPPEPVGLDGLAGLRRLDLGAGIGQDGDR